MRNPIAVMASAVLVAAGLSACGTQSGSGSVASPTDAGAPPTGSADAGSSSGPAQDAGAAAGGGGGGTASDAGATGGSGGSGGGGSSGGGSGGGGSSGGGSGSGGGTGSGSGGGVADAGGGGSGGSGGSGGGASSDAGTGGTADAGAPQGATKLTDGEGAAALAVDATNIYWINQIGVAAPGQYAVRMLAKDANPRFVQSLAAGSGSQVRGMVAADGDVYWTMWQCAPPCDYPGAGSDRYVFHVSASGGGVRLMGPGWSQLVLDAQFVYARSMHGYVSRIPRDGTPNTQLTVDAGDGTSLTSDRDHLYWAQPVQGDGIELRQIDKTGANENTRLVTGPTSFPDSMILADGWFFYRDVSGNVARINFSSPATPEILWHAPNGTDLEVTGGRIYWTQSAADKYPGCLGVSNLDGTDGHCIDEGPFQYGPVRADESFVYFVRNGDIFRIARQ